MATILTGAGLAEAAGLKERFISNSERYATIATTASVFGQNHIEQLAAIHPLVVELSTYRYIPSAGLTIDGVLAAVRAAVKALLKVKLEAVNVVKPLLEAFVATPRNDVFKSLKALSDITDAFDKTKAALLEHPTGTVALLVSIAWQELSMSYFNMLEKRRRATPLEAKEH